ncbi:MAG: polyprenyl synthetase family protein [Candidatus Omnitrophica bacterium]|nr:polyprenyl synthetase family protein [Candidatus Omnitrophota bacterium]
MKHFSSSGILLTIQDKIEKELAEFLKSIKSRFSGKKIEPVLFDSIEDFLLRKGKRLRPVLFIISYLGFAEKAKKRLYTTAVSFEFLHDFLLVHDDIIDKAFIRRGKPSMHKILESAFVNRQNKKFNGEDLAIIAGDILYALAIDSFLSIEEKKLNKERALKKFIESAVWTELGEFLELIYGLKPVDKITLQDIYQVYTMKTAYYTFAYPLSIGAVLAGANQKQVDALFNCGLLLGRAFQIKDDILGIFGEESGTGKSSFTDLKEEKKTILIWFGYNNASLSQKKTIRNIFNKRIVLYKDLLKMREILINTGALEYAKEQINILVKDAEKDLVRLQMKPEYKNIILDYSHQILQV